VTRISGIRPAPELPEADGPEPEESGGAAQASSPGAGTAGELEDATADGGYAFTRRRLLFFEKEIPAAEAAERLGDDGYVTAYETRTFGGVRVHTATGLEGAGDLSDFLAIEGRSVEPESVLARVGRALDTLEERGNDLRFVSLGLAATSRDETETRLVQTYGGGFQRMSPMAAARRLVNGQPIAVVAEDVVQWTTEYGESYMSAEVTGQTIIESVEDLERFFGASGLPT
jgi:hypothetical protein